MITVANTPASTPTPSRSTNENRVAGTPRSSSSSVSKITTATIAAVTSLTIPSVSSAVATWSLTRTTLSIGVMTVGPVATSSAPISSAISQSAPSKNRTAAAVPRNITTALTVTSRSDTLDAPLIRSICRANAPSKTMIATLIPTMISRPAPNVSSVTSPNTSGPSTTPMSR